MVGMYSMVRVLTLVMTGAMTGVGGQGYYPTLAETNGIAGVPLPQPAYKNGRNRERSSRCYTESGRPQKCVPEFVNAAFNGRIDVSNECGVSRPQEYCLQTGGFGSAKDCKLCDVALPALSHPAYYLTDADHDDNKTWWQSETMLEGVQYPHEVNLTLHLGKAYDITYVRLYFRSPRPESFAIYKRTSPNHDWKPYHFYSATCQDTYHLPESSYLGKDETRALCTSDFSDISPLTGGNVPFSTLENRPSAYAFDFSKQLQEWVTATDIRIVLDRPNTFGDEVFGDPKVLRSYFYAVYDFAVGGRCKCNGHASDCVETADADGRAALTCVCQHRTTGPDCDQCLPFYNDQPWGRATSKDAHECEACDCNGYSKRCYFDQSLYEKTGHGGHCLDCTANRDGPNCQRCRHDYYEIEGGMCIACGCDAQGSRSLQCGSDGKCLCKPGVTGDKCDMCQDDYYSFSTQGCDPCGCSPGGSLANTPSCDAASGVCACKGNVEGQQCDQCKPGFFSLELDNEFGCTPCFCYGHSSVCQSAGRYTKGVIESGFVRGVERWRAGDWAGRHTPVSYNAAQRILELVHTGPEKVYFLSPDRFLGDQRASYNQHLGFQLRIGGSQSQASTEDVVLEGAGLVISAPIFAQNNPLPNDQPQVFSFRLHEDPKFGWSPRLSSQDFIALLSNLTALKIRGTYFYDGKGFLDDVRLETARRGVFGVAANWVEMCSCPEGYVGQYCESCAPGYRHDPPNGGAFAACVPCSCNQHAEDCDSTTGQCICQHNTAGTQCERCAKGYYGNALVGTPSDCQPCECPNGGACIQLQDSQVVCLECPTGYAGPRCDICTDGYFGDPKGRKDAPMPCERCDCSGNIDPNAVANCNRTTGECLKCIYNTGGALCDKCLPGFFGDALAPTKGDCAPCHCHHYGTEPEPYGPPVCHQVDGQCKCRPHVEGRACDRCESGFWNLASGIGCADCNCDPLGSLNSTCDSLTGQCFCRPGVSSLKCDTCRPHHFGFGLDGCSDCGCDPVGSVSLQCGDVGSCQCRDNVEGRTCDRCRENTYDKEAGCRDCPACYTLVLDSVSIHRERLAELERLLLDIVNNPTVLDDQSFEKQLSTVLESVNELWETASGISGGGETVERSLQELQDRIAKVRGLVESVADALERGAELAGHGDTAVGGAEAVLERARHVLGEAQVRLSVEGEQAYNLAANRSREYGAQSARMTQLSVEARHEADTQEQEATSIEAVAAAAKNASAEAFSLVRQAFEDQTEASQAVKELRALMDSLESLHNTTMTRATESLQNAKLIIEESLKLSTDASGLDIPAIDIPSLKAKAGDIERRATKILEELATLVRSKASIMENIDLELAGARVLLERGLLQQERSEELKADAFANKQSAQEAVQKADKILEDAESTLKILQEFDDQVRVSKVEAARAMERIADIERIIISAEDQTAEANSALRGAEEDARRGEATAVVAQDTAQEAGEAAGKVRATATKTRMRATELKTEAESLSSDVKAAETKLVGFEERADEDSDLLDQAQTAANKAKSRAESAVLQVRTTQQMVAEILALLGQSPELEPGLLQSLERRLEEAANMYQMSGISTSVEQLTEARNWNQNRVVDYSEMIRLLQVEVRNVEDIKVSLPDGCFRQTKLEP